VAAFFSIEYVTGRLAGRPILLKALSFVHISEKDIEEELFSD
jgi:membrane protein DedA with SNARE-associated domain